MSEKLVRQPGKVSPQTVASSTVKGLLSPALSSRGGEGEPLARCSRLPEACEDRFPTPHSERAVALVITLVLLSVITFMTVTFLVVSHAQHGAVTTETDQAVARFAAESATQRAIAELLAPIVASGNEFNYGLLVSTNYINPAGFLTAGSPNGLPYKSPTNVNYSYPNGAPLNLNDTLQNLANLLYNPRAPVFIVTNTLTAQSNDFRFYLDLNRNGSYDPSGLQAVISADPTHPYYDTNGNPMTAIVPGNTLSNFFIGDPEWIGGLQRPEFAHSATNLFTHRYAYLVVPAGQTLDANTIHNFTKSISVSPNSVSWPDGFLRNQGILTAEMNLAAFLVDLNTNYWPGPGSSRSAGAPYIYYPYNLNLQNGGFAFQDAASFIRYRYGTVGLNYRASVSSLFPPPANGALAFNNATNDAYSAGPVMTGTWWTPPVGFTARVNNPWAAADNPNHFYSTQDFFDKNKFPSQTGGKIVPPTFVDRLWAAGTNTDSYNRYTFYRLLSQLGTDSAPEPGGKMNLNYSNVDNNGYVVVNAVTNFTAWQPPNFFVNAAIRLLADAGYTVGAATSTSNILVLGSVAGPTGMSIPITNLHIPIWPTSFYTPSVHRLLQLAANMYDATSNTNRYYSSAQYPTNGFPTVFRPIFTDTYGGGGRAGGGSQGSPVYIINYDEPTTSEMTALVGLIPVPHDLTDVADPRPVKSRDMVYGIPLVIGAKKGFPNFNKFAMQSLVQVTRKLQYHRPSDSTTLPVNEIDQMFIVGVSNVFGVEAWNSYSTPYPRNLQMVALPDLSVMLTNLETRKELITPWRYLPPATSQTIPGNTWPGYASSGLAWLDATSFIMPLTNGTLPFTNHVFLTNAIYRTPNYTPAPDQFAWPLTGAFERTKGTTNFHVPQFQIKLKARLRFALVDRSVNPPRIVDYVNLANDITTNLNDVLTAGGACGEPHNVDSSNGSMWCTNRANGSTLDSTPTYGIQNQIEASLGHFPNDSIWNSAILDAPLGVSDKKAAIAFFQGQFQTNYPYYSNSFNAPYQPYRNMYLVTSWQANDPLVHYTVGDLTDVTTTNIVLDQFSSAPSAPTDFLGALNKRYEPWGGTPGKNSSSLTAYDLRVKDPVAGLRGLSDNWDFPANKLPNVGWLGRVHRGTPWQTVYLKPSTIDLPTWQTWTGNGVVMTNFGQTTIVPTNYTYSDAYLTQPTNDWHLLDLFTAALDDNATRGQLSINQTNLAAWSAALSGIIALTNTVDADGNPAWAPQVIDPAGVYNPVDATTWPPLVRLVKRINDFRGTNSARHVFSRLSDLLAVPEMTVASPFLNTNTSPTDQGYALNDAVIERLPQQIAGLLKVDTTPRFVIYAFGQTLKPESTRAIVKSGTFAGLCTNYQIVAEAATRTVVRFDGIPPNQGTNPITALHPVIESFNVLPPD